MSAALYGRDSAGVNRQIKKLYANVGGVNREIKELWARDSGGVNRKIFSSAITWTYTVATTGSISIGVPQPGSWTIGQNIKDGSFSYSVVFTFDSHIVLLATQSIFIKKNSNFNPWSGYLRTSGGTSHSIGGYENTWLDLGSDPISTMEFYQGNVTHQGGTFDSIITVTLYLADGRSFELNDSGAYEN